MKLSFIASAGHKTRTKDKYRVVYTEHQKVELEKEFLFSQYITIQRKAELAGSIGLSDRQVKIWFQNRRAKERKSRRRASTGNVGAANTGSGGAASVAPAAVGGAKTAVLDEAPRLRGQLQQQCLQHLQPYRSSDVIKVETVYRSHDNVTSSTPQLTGGYCAK